MVVHHHQNWEATNQKSTLCKEAVNEAEAMRSTLLRSNVWSMAEVHTNRQNENGKRKCILQWHCRADTYIVSLASSIIYFNVTDGDENIYQTESAACCAK